MFIEEEDNPAFQATILTVKGDFWGGDEWTLHESIKRLAERGKIRLVVDLASVARMNSQGIGVLVACLTTLKDHGGTMKIAGANPGISAHLDLLKLYAVLDSYPTVTEALAGFAS